MRLRYLQRFLERINGIDVKHCVEDFVITDAKAAQRIDTSANARDSKEKLLVRQDGDNLDIALYLDAEIIEHLKNENPLRKLHNDNLTDFWIVLEGISHFLYLIWNACLPKCVTLMELEMQAEIDKYIAAMWLLGRQNGGKVPRQLRPRLFDAANFDESLDPKTLARYKDANYFAGKYCMQLENRYLETGSDELIFAELRRFYRLPQIDKIRRIQTGAVTR